MTTPARRVRRGAFICLEGLDRVGKTTQAGLLQTALQNKPLLLRFPNRDSPLTGAALQAYLQRDACSAPDANDLRMMHLLFTANRWEAQTRILSALRSGQDVVADRWSYSGVAYSVACGVDPAWCLSREDGLVKPDLVLWLRADAETAQQRPGFGDEALERPDIQKAAHEWYESYWRSQGTEMVVVSAEGTLEDVHERIMTKVLLAKTDQRVDFWSDPQAF